MVAFIYVEPFRTGPYFRIFIELQDPVGYLRHHQRLGDGVIPDACQVVDGHLPVHGTDGVLLRVEQPGV